MSPHAQPTPKLSVTVVTAPGCHLCDDAHDTLEGLARDGAPLEVSLVDAASPAGMALISWHRPALNPLVLVDGAYFSSGRLPRRKLQALIEGFRTDAGSVSQRG